MKKICLIFYIFNDIMFIHKKYFNFARSPEKKSVLLAGMNWRKR